MPTARFSFSAGATPNSGSAVAEMNSPPSSPIARSLKGDQTDRQTVYRRRYDFYIGDQASYTTIVGRVAKEKKGHANAVYNYAGKTAVKIGYGLSNNPPKVTVPARTMPEDFVEAERHRTQGVEDFSEEVFKRNRFWKGAYRPRDGCRPRRPSSACPDRHD